MRPLDRLDPRWVALLLVPVLLAAGAAHAPDVPSAAAGTRVALAPQALPQLGEAVEPAAHVLLSPGERPSATRASRAAPDDSGGSGGSGGESRARPSARTPDERGRSALRALGYDPASLGYRIRFLPSHSGALGTTNRRSRLITVHVRLDQSELVLRTTIAHELGHALDFAHGSGERRAAYRKARHLPAGPWFPCDRCEDYASPAGDFAEVFAVWLAGPGDYRGRLAGPPTPAQLRELAPLFRVPTSAVQASPAPAPSPRPTQQPDKGLPDLLGPPATPAPAHP